MQLFNYIKYDRLCNYVHYVINAIVRNIKDCLGLNKLWHLCKFQWKYNHLLICTLFVHAYRSLNEQISIKCKEINALEDTVYFQLMFTPLCNFSFNV